MLALQTGWTPDVLAELPTRFLRRCRWLMYARAIAGPEGLPVVDIPSRAPIEVRLAAQESRAQLMKIRTLLFPDGD